jgi:hypothetical protein
VDHTCPSDSTRTIPSPAFIGWQVALGTTSGAGSNDPGCGASVGPSGTGTVDGTGQTFIIPGSALLNSDGDSLTITGTYTLTGSQCCNSNGPGTPLFTDEYTISGTFSFPFCNGPCAGLDFGVSCSQRTIEDGGGVFITGGVIYSYCTPTGTVVVSTTGLGDLGDPYGTPPIITSLTTPTWSERAKLPAFPNLDTGTAKIRVGFTCPCLVSGGAETWMSTLAKSLDERFQVVGLAVNGPTIDPEAVEAYRGICPVAESFESVRTLARHCDILIAWGKVDYASAWRADPSKPFLLSVCHIPQQWDEGLGPSQIARFRPAAT